MNQIAEMLADYTHEPIVCALSDEMNHGILMSRLVCLLAKELEMPEEFCYKMSMAGMLHDLGKLEIWQYLHAGDGARLQIERTRYTRAHPTLGYLALTKQGIDEEVCQAVLHHHENYDGSGYPDNLKGEEIPLGARILRVCDVFAALVSDRVYREAFSEDVAMELMVDEVKNFDMSIYLAFQRLVGDPAFDEIRKLIDQYNDGYHRIRQLTDDADKTGEDSL